MPDETFSTLTPQQGDTPEILRMKLGVAASRLAALLQNGVAVDLAAVKTATESLAMAGLNSLPSDVSSMRSALVESIMPMLQQLVPLPVTVRCLENFCYGASWQAAASSPTYFRLAYVWGATLAGVANQGPLRLRHGTNDNRIINPGQMLVIEAPSGQQLNLQAFQFYGGYYYYGDSLAWELY